MTTASVDTVESPSRYCAQCSQHKSIRGVWYLVQATGSTDSTFYCESCFNTARAGASSSPEAVDSSRVPSGPSFPDGASARRGF